MINEKDEGIYVELDDSGMTEENSVTEDSFGTETNDSDNQGIGEGRFKSADDLYKSYQNLEKKLGEQGRIIGELKKGSGTDKQGDDKFKRLEELEKIVYSDDFDPYDAESRKLQKEFSKLNREYSSEIAEKRLMTKMSQRENLKVVDSFSNEYKDLSDVEMEQVVDFAQSALADANGAIKKSDLEASLFKMYPDKFKKYLQLSAVQQERERIKGAFDSQQPRMSATNTTQNRVDVGRLLKENPDFPYTNPKEWKRISRRLSDEQLNKLLRG